MAEEVPEGTFEIPIAGRMMRFHKSSQGSLIALRRVLTRLYGQFNAAHDPELRTQLTDKIAGVVLDVAESRFVDAQDRDFVEQQMMLGVIDMPDVMRIFANGAIDKDSVPDDAPPPAKKTAAKRTPKAAPVKKTANASRARR